MIIPYKGFEKVFENYFSFTFRNFRKYAREKNRLKKLTREPKEILHEEKLLYTNALNSSF